MICITFCNITQFIFLFRCDNDNMFYAVINCPRCRSLGSKQYYPSTVIYASTFWKTSSGKCCLFTLHLTTLHLTTLQPYHPSTSPPYSSATPFTCQKYFHVCSQLFRNKTKNVQQIKANQSLSKLQNKSQQLFVSVDR